MSTINTTLTIKDIPQSPSGKTGWPWTEQSESLAELMPHGCEWPRISIVTPSYNQGEFIEETIRSVLLQGYPNLEYIIIDGGSTDNTVEIIKKYEPFLTYWVSEPDRGQSHAINKGLEKITGDIWAYINSDDIYSSRCFKQVALEFYRHPDILWLTGFARYVDQTGKEVEVMIPTPLNSQRDALIRWEGLSRPICIEASNFMSKSILEKYGFYNENLHYCMDFEFNLKLFFNGIKPVIISEVLADARLHDSSKTIVMGSQGAFREEEFKIISDFIPSLSSIDQKYIEKKISNYNFWNQLEKVEKSLINNGHLAAIEELVNTLRQYPFCLLTRPILGTVRNILNYKNSQH